MGYKKYVTNVISFAFYFIVFYIVSKYAALYLDTIGVDRTFNNLFSIVFFNMTFYEKYNVAHINYIFQLGFFSLMGCCVFSFLTSATEFLQNRRHMFFIRYGSKNHYLFIIFKRGLIHCLAVLTILILVWGITAYIVEGQLVFSKILSGVFYCIW